MEQPSDTTQQVPPRPPGVRRLVRQPDAGPLGGVCAGLATYFNVDPTIVRIAAVVLAFMGPGVPSYLIAWAFLPKDDGTQSLAATVGPGAGQRDRGTQVLGIVLMVVAVSILWGDWWIPGGRGWLVPLGLIGLGAWLLLRSDDAVPPPPPVPPTPWAGGTAPWPAATTAAPAPGVEDPALEGDGEPASDLGDDPADPDADPTLAGPPDGPPPPPPPGSGWGPTGPTGPTPGPAGRRRVVGPIVFGALSLWAGLAWLFGIELETGLAVALCIVGLGFVLGAFLGGSWALLPPAVLLVVALVFTSVVDIPFRGGIGDREWRPLTSAELDDTYELGVGESTLDLRHLVLEPGEDVRVRVHQGIGHLVVYVPADTELDVDADVGMGQADVLGRRDDGVGVALKRSTSGDPANGSIELDLQLGVGHLEVIEVEGARRVDVAPEPVLPEAPSTTVSVPR